MTPELKSPAVPMPFNGFSQHEYAQKLIDEYKAANVPASDVYAQSFNLMMPYWLANEADGNQAVYLDGRYNEPILITLTLQPGRQRWMSWYNRG